MKKNTTTEDIKVKGSNVIERIQEVIKEGNVRHISIKDKNGNVIAQFPLTIGVIGTALAPVLAGIGAIVALITECTITVERVTEK